MVEVTRRGFMALVGAAAATTIITIPVSLQAGEVAAAVPVNQLGVFSVKTGRSLATLVPSRRLSTDEMKWARKWLTNRFRAFLPLDIRLERADSDLLGSLFDANGEPLVIGEVNYENDIE